MVTKRERNEATAAFLVANSLLSSFVEKNRDIFVNPGTRAEYERLRDAALMTREKMELTRQP